MSRTIYRERLASSPLLGRHVHHDSESRRYAFDTSGLSIVSTKHTRRIDVLDQQSLGSCTGNAGIGCLGTDPYYDTLAPSRPLTVEVDGARHSVRSRTLPRYTFNEDGAVLLYSDATRLDDYPGQYPPTDTGSSGLAVAKALKAAGEISGYTHTFSLDDALKALTLYPVITGTIWYQSMFSPTSDGRLIVDARSGVAGGHEYVVDEVDAERERVWMTNSWGTGWSLGGRAWMTFADWGSLLAAQGDVVVFVPLSSPAPIPTPTPADPADTAFAAVLRRHDWAHKHHIGDNARVARAARDWLAAKNL